MKVFLAVWELTNKPLYVLVSIAVRIKQVSNTVKPVIYGHCFGRPLAL